MYDSIYSECRFLDINFISANSALGGQDSKASFKEHVISNFHNNVGVQRFLHLTLQFVFKFSTRPYHLAVKVFMVQESWMSVGVHFT